MSTRGDFLQMRVHATRRSERSADFTMRAWASYCFVPSPVTSRGSVVNIASPSAGRSPVFAQAHAAAGDVHRRWCGGCARQNRQTKRKKSVTSGFATKCDVRKKKKKKSRSNDENNAFNSELSTCIADTWPSAAVVLHLV